MQFYILCYWPPQDQYFSGHYGKQLFTSLVCTQHILDDFNPVRKKGEGGGGKGALHAGCSLIVQQEKIISLVIMFPEISVPALTRHIQNCEGKPETKIKEQINIVFLCISVSGIDIKKTDDFQLLKLCNYLVLGIDWSASKNCGFYLIYLTLSLWLNQENF